MGQSPRQLTPRGYALGLHQVLPLADQFLGHLVKGHGKLANLVFAGCFYFYAPVALPNFARSLSQISDRAADASGHDPADNDANKNGHARDYQTDVADAL